LNCRQHLAVSEEVYAKYKKDINFIMVDTIEAYPVGSACPYDPKGEQTLVESSYTVLGEDGMPIQQPKTYAARVQQATTFVNTLKITIPMLVDEMDNAVWCTYGPASNIAYFIDRDGTILEKEPYYVPETMDEVIQKYLKAK
jgi:hypothetical protein